MYIFASSSVSWQTSPGINTKILIKDVASVVYPHCEGGSADTSGQVARQQQRLRPSFFVLFIPAFFSVPLLLFKAKTILLPGNGKAVPVFRTCLHGSEERSSQVWKLFFSGVKHLRHTRAKYRTSAKEHCFIKKAFNNFLICLFFSIFEDNLNNKSDARRI